jgi:hypothetical protein
MPDPHAPYHISPAQLAHYTVRRAAAPIAVDGDLAKPAWEGAERSARFTDLVTGRPVALDTRVAALYDDRALYLAYWCEEPFVTATLTERDDRVYLDNDIEFFLDGEDTYYELEINAFGTVYEVFFVYQDALTRGSRFDGDPRFDLHSRDVDILGGFQDYRYESHHRGRRWAFRDWDFPGLETAVRVDGRINDPGHADRGWTAEIALPWAGMADLYPGRGFPPRPGDHLRAQFFRFELADVPGHASPQSLGWALNPHGVYDSHIPENFAYLDFA